MTGVFKFGVRVMAVLAMAWFATATPAAARQYTAIVMDYDTGKIIHSSHVDKLVYPASLTKMMTLYMLFDAMDAGKLSLKSKLKVSRRAAGMPASRLGLKRGATISVEDAIFALTTKSANDVAVVIAEALADSEIQFAIKMTKKARALGMSKTTFKNASGLPNRHQKTTARDMATLARSLISRHGDRYRYFSAASFRYNGRTYRTHNRLMKRYDGMDGLKTGYIQASGFNLAASAKRNGRRIITVVFGGRTATSRDAEVARLMDLGFSKLPKKPEPAPLLVLGPPRIKPAAPATVLASIDPVLPKPAMAGTQTDEPQIVALAESLVDDSGDLPVVVAPVVASDDDLMLPAPKPGMRLKEGQPKQLAQGDYGVQVGAYHDANKARRQAYRIAQKLPSILLKGNVDVSALRSGRRPVYRSRLVGLSQKEAETACKALHRQKQDCLVLRTGPMRVAAAR